MKHLLNKTLLTSGALASLLLSVSLTSCQDENLGFTQEEIHQTYLDRKYAEEFAKAFPNVDPNHTWMCAPDTFGVESLIEGLATRAYPTGMTPSWEKLSTKLEETNDFITAALEFLPEAENNKGKLTQSFDYLAVEDDGTPNDNFAEYIITPSFWGRKFCESNTMGIYWYDNKGTIHHIQNIWHDYTANGEDNGIRVRYTNGYEEDMINSEYQINHDRVWSNTTLDHQYALGRPCTKCGVELHAGKSYITANDKTHNSSAVDLVDEQGWICVKLVSKESVNYQYDTQLQVTSPVAFKGGETVHFKMKYHTNWGAQSQTTLHYELHQGTTYKLEGDTGKPLITTPTPGQWNDLEFDVTIPTELNNIDRICLDLNVKKDPAINNGQEGFGGEGRTFWFREISWRKETCKNCNNEGYYPVDKFILPQYLVKIPVGMKWGIFFSTLKQQGHASNPDTDWQWYYSNANLNRITDNMEPANTGLVYAASTYQAKDPNGELITYCCFEDAATNLHNGGKKGECECGYGHYDTDYNDFVFTIKGRPVITSYQALKYRVMCEDLGGTWDWDFNDVVYDVEYADAENGAGNATVKVTLQAVGGTLPVTMQFATYFSEDNIIQSTNVHSGSNYTTQDLHKVLDSSNSTNAKGLYTPVNVTPSAKQQTVTEKNPQLVCTYTLNAAKYPNFDARRFVELITIKVNQKPLNESGQNTTTTVHFPTAKGDANLIPECFMTSINANWTAENQIITAKYPNFVNWVEDNKNNTHWWDIGIGQ